MTYTPHAKPYVLDLNPVEAIENLKHLPAILKEGDFMLAQLYKDLKLVAADIAAIQTAVSASTAKVTQSQTFLPFLADDNSGDEPISLLPGGPPGARGIQGFQGPPGLDGDQGEDGAQGPVGAIGATGSTGATGPTGPAGAQGVPGSGLVVLENDLEDIIIPVDSYLIGPNPASCSAYNSATQSVPSGAFTVLTLDTTDFDTSNGLIMHSTVSNTSRVVAPYTGIYVINALSTFPGGAGGTQRVLRMQVNSSTLLITNAFTLTVAIQFEISRVAKLNAGDYVELLAFQDSGANMAIGNASPGSGDSRLEMALIQRLT